jgi:hypothetical protein
MEVYQKISFLSKHKTIVDFNHVSGGVKIKVTINGRTTQFDKLVSLQSINLDDWKKNPLKVTIDYYVNKYKINTDKADY